MSQESNGIGGVVPALIVAAGLVAGCLLLSNALHRTADELAGVASAIGEVQVAGAPSDRPSPSRPRRPEANKEYKVAVGQAPVRGPADAEITIVEWSDFQCPFCSRATPTLARIQEAYGDRVRIAFKHLPLSIHAQAPAAHAAAEAAHRQGRFWEMHDKIFENPRDLSPATFERYAGEIGLDLARFKTDAASAEVRKRIDADMRQAQELNVSGTPSFFINGRFLSGAQPFENFKRVIDAELEKNS